MIPSWALVPLLVLGIISGAPLPTEGAEESDLLRFLELAERSYAEVRDYTAILLRRELIDDALRDQETILLKFQRPFKVYLKWLDGPGKGREGLYVAGANKGRFLVREPRGIRRLFTVALDPADPRVLEESRHPVTDVGIGRLLEIIGENVRRAARNGVLQLVDRGPGIVADRRAYQVEGILPSKPGAGYYCYRVFLSFDEENDLPIRVVVYDWDDRIVEQYEYTQLRLNAALSDQDFDPRNPDYGFSIWRISIPK